MGLNLVKMSHDNLPFGLRGSFLTKFERIYGKIAQQKIDSSLKWMRNLSVDTIGLMQLQMLFYITVPRWYNARYLFHRSTMSQI